MENTSAILSSLWHMQEYQMCVIDYKPVSLMSHTKPGYYACQSIVRSVTFESSKYLESPWSRHRPWRSWSPVLYIKRCDVLGGLWLDTRSPRSRGWQGWCVDCEKWHRLSRSERIHSWARGHASRKHQEEGHQKHHRSISPALLISKNSPLYIRSATYHSTWFSGF